MALNATMATAARSLEVFQTGVEVAGQNISNANTPGYIREELHIESGPTYKSGRLIRGTGSNVGSIQLALDAQQELRIYAANSDLAASSVKQEAHFGIEAALAELGDGDISSRMNELISALNEYANEPTLPGLRELVITEGQAFAESLNYTREQVDRVRTTYNAEIESTVVEANELIEQIHELNVQIVNLEGGGAIRSDAVQLRTDRLNALDRLSEIVEIHVDEIETGAVNVRTANEYLIIDHTRQGFSTYVPSEDEGSVYGLGVRFSETLSTRLTESGELTGLVEARDEILGGFTTELDNFAASFLFEFNKIHAAGTGASGYESIVSGYAVDDTTATLNDLSGTGLPFGATHGSFNVVLVDQNTGVERTSNIVVDLDGIGGNDTTLDDLATSLDAVDDLNASIDGDGRLRLTTNDGYEVKFNGDSSGILASLGINTFFEGIDAETITVREEIRNDSSKLAGGQGGGPGDATNALALIDLFESPLEEFGGRSIGEQYESLVFNVSHAASAERANFEGFEIFHDSLMSQREQYSGVSIDEETVRLLQFQQSYQAAARVLSTVNELMELLISIG